MLARLRWNVCLAARAVTSSRLPSLCTSVKGWRIRVMLLRMGTCPATMLPLVLLLLSLMAPSHRTRRGDKLKQLVGPRALGGGTDGKLVAGERHARRLSSMGRCGWRAASVVSWQCQ